MDIRKPTESFAFGIDTAAQALGLGRNTVLGLIHSGRLGHVRVGRRIIVPRWELEAFLEREAQK